MKKTKTIKGVEVTTTIAAIETHYKGCRFRSRLEARWAVFFDAMEIPWEYEPQGYAIDGEGYLPDFWIPSLGLWVEVKGVFSHKDFRRVIRAAGDNGLPLGLHDERRPSPTSPDTWGARLLVLGQVPEPGQTWRHELLGYLAGEVTCNHAFFARRQGAWAVVTLGWPLLIGRYPGLTGDDSESEACTATARAGMVSNSPLVIVEPYPSVTNAYRAARSARFEHGESGGGR